MDERLAVVAAGHGGVLSSADAARVDVQPVRLDALVRSGRLVRVRRGAYVLREAYDAADPQERYRLRTKAVLRTRPPVDAASHHAGVLLHGVDTYDVDLAVVDVVARVKAPRVRSGLRTHPGAGLTADRANGWNVLHLPTALCQVAGGSGIVAAVASTDDALPDGRCTVEQLHDAVGLVPEHHRGLAERAIALTDPAGESVGETRTRLLLRDLGFTVASQRTLVRERTFVARVDFLVDGVVVVEFDGLVKYAGQNGRAALAAEKARESAVVDLGYEVTAGPPTQEFGRHAGAAACRPVLRVLWIR
ncbi:MAG TPA: type IV toxin-antitoxin system AbiEi family antitoxin domain-containing protein [Ornithinibacter sp.]|nr:type IV toxin-antitoxin system AbiEi family antitoxin domain-containing protein [Ornithinibacter sp.]